MSSQRNNIKPSRSNINRLCRLKKCEHADINTSDVGRIVDIKDDGYAIEYTKNFKILNKVEPRTEVIYGEAKDTEII